MNVCVERGPQVVFIFRIEGVTKERVLYEVEGVIYFPQLEQEQSEPQLPVKLLLVYSQVKDGMRGNGRRTA